MKVAENIKKVYLIGIGGIGMSALARYFKSSGALVSGYDKTPGMLTESLASEGIPVYFDENPDHIEPDTDLVIYTPAVPPEHKERVHAESKGFRLMKRSEVLGMITSGMFTVAVAGTHGKTSISGMTSHMLKTAGFRISAFIGGISKNYSTNVIFDNDPQLAVVEADEYDRSFLRLSPDIAVITAMDPDHLDIYGTHEEMIRSFGEFVNKLSRGGTLVLHEKIDIPVPEGVRVIRYGLNAATGFSATDVAVSGGRQRFRMKTDCAEEFELTAGVPGLHNIENALAAAALCSAVGVPSQAMAEAIESYRGIVRRFDLRFKSERMVYIDDYAHHPEELRRLIGAVREIYPGKHITGIFQPHLFSRTRDLAEEFALSLKQLDELWMMDIYPARELPLPGITGEFLLGKVSLKNKCLCKPAQVIEKLEGLKDGVLITAGAGDIDQLVQPIENSLRKIFRK
jgi:UDP-N-acetylmuramate--alanine ligase